MTIPLSGENRPAPAAKRVRDMLFNAEHADPPRWPREKKCWVSSTLAWSRYCLSTSSTLTTSPLPSRSISRKTAFLSRTTLAFAPLSSRTGLIGYPSPTLNGRGASEAGFQIPPIVGEPCSEWKSRKSEP